MKKTLFGILAVVVLAGGALLVTAQKKVPFGGPGFGPGGGHGGPMIGIALRGLDLTDDQKAKVKEIMDASRTNAEPLMQQMQANHKALEDLSAAGGFDEAKVSALATEQGGIMAKLVVERERTKSQVFALLTDAQKAKAAEMRQNFEEHFKDGKGFEGKRPDSEF